MLCMKFCKYYICRFCLLLFVGLSCVAETYSQVRDNWYIQAGLDMSLTNPYGYDFGDVFPNGKSFGVDVAAGRWFTHQLGLRAKLNWENGIRLFENDHAEWLSPFHQVGVNMDRGGYITVLGDIQFNIRNLLSGYETHAWDVVIFSLMVVVLFCTMVSCTTMVSVVIFVTTLSSAGTAGSTATMSGSSIVVSSDSGAFSPENAKMQPTMAPIATKAMRI